MKAFNLQCVVLQYPPQVSIYVYILSCRSHAMMHIMATLHNINIIIVGSIIK